MFPIVSMMNYQLGDWVFQVPAIHFWIFGTTIDATPVILFVLAVIAYKLLPFT